MIKSKNITIDDARVIARAYNLLCQSKRDLIPYLEKGDPTALEILRMFLSSEFSAEENK